MGVERLQQEYTDGTRRVIAALMSKLSRIPITANQVTMIGFVINVIAAVLVYRESFIAGGVVFLIGSILDVFDGAVARARREEIRAGERPCHKRAAPRRVHVARMETLRRCARRPGASAGSSLVARRAPSQ